VLLSSIEGAAVTAVRVEGVLHEFSPIPGAMEDTTDLILNLKRVPLKMHVDHPKSLLLRTSEPGEVRAKHITPDPDVEILDPEAYVATLGAGSTLAVEMRIKQGRGYVSADKNFDQFAEPFAALDEITRDRMAFELMRIWQRYQKTVIFITHSLAEAVFLSNRILVMSANPGRIHREVRVDFRKLMPVTAVVLMVLVTLSLSAAFLDVRQAFGG
jgi:ABC-type uncharacterized transport system ATPase subunit